MRTIGVTLIVWHFCAAVADITCTWPLASHVSLAIRDIVSRFETDANHDVNY